MGLVPIRLLNTIGVAVNCPLEHAAELATLVSDRLDPRPQVGSAVGRSEGSGVGGATGTPDVGLGDGWVVGRVEGKGVGTGVGSNVGSGVGRAVGLDDGGAWPSW